MTMRLAFRIDGDASGAKQAFAETEGQMRALDATAKRAGAGLPALANTLGGSGPNSIAGGSRFAAGQMANLNFQINDIVSGLAMGQSPFQIMAQQGGQVYQILSMHPRGVGGALAELKSQLLSLITPGRAIVLGFTAAAAAAYGLYSYLKSQGPTVEDNLDEQARLLGIVKDAYNKAAGAAGEFYKQSKAITELQAQQSLLALQNNLQSATGGAIKSITRPTSVPSEIPMDGVDGAIANASVGATNFAALNAEIERFNASARSASDVQAFRDAVAAIGFAASGTNPQLAEAANNLLKTSQAAGDLALSVIKAEAMLRLLNGTATETDRKVLGLADATKKGTSAYESLMQRTQDRIAELKMEAQTAGMASDAVLKMKLQHDAERAAKSSGVSVNQQWLDQLKEEIALATRAANLAQIRADIGFERKTMFLPQADQEAAQKLRGIYGNDVDTALQSAEAGQMRINAQLREGRDLGFEFASGLARDLKQGVDGADALSNALGRVGDRLMDLLLNQGINALFKSGSGGLGGLLSLFGGGGELPGFGTPNFVGPMLPTGLSGGGYTGAGGRYEPAGIVHRGEYVFSAPSVDRIGLARLDRMHRGYADGGLVGGPPAFMGARAGGAPSMSFTYAPVIDARNADSSAVAQLAGVMAEDKKNFLANVQKAVQQLGVTTGAMR